MPERPKRQQDGDLRPPKIVTDLATAERFRGLLDAGEAFNRADLARRFRLTRARVTQLMKLLDLHPAIIAYLKALPPGTPTRKITERGLRAIVRLPPRQQVSTARRQLWGFAEFTDRSAVTVA